MKIIAHSLILFLVRSLFIFIQISKRQSIHSIRSTEPVDMGNSGPIHF